MKKLIALLLCACALDSTFAGNFYESGGRHEVSAGLGAFTSTDLFNSPSFWGDGCCYGNVATVYYSYTPAFDVNYFFKLGRKFKLGVNFTYQKTSIETKLLRTDVPSYYYDLFELCESERTRSHILREIEDYKSNIENAKKDCGVENTHNFLVMPQIKLTLLSKKHFALYQRYGLGMNFMTISKNGQTTHEKQLDLVIVPIAWEFGGTRFRAFAEFPAFSAQGIIHVGMKYEF